MSPTKTFSPRLFYCKGCLWLLLFAIFLAGCNQATPAETPALPAATTEAAPVPIATNTAEAPTPTPQPLAAQVNETGITVAEYQAELARYQQAVGREPGADDRQVVLDDLINQTLLAQAATEKGFTLDEPTLQARLDKLTEQVGGEQNLSNWLQANGYTETDFRQQLARAASAAWMRDEILAQMPETVEQVRARQILLRTAEEAFQTLARLQAGEDFETLASQVDPVTGGEMGWFPRGYLFFPALEDAAFSLEPGKFSDIIETTSGFHILYVIERDPARPLDPQARLALQEQALQSWLEQRRQNSKVEIISP